MHSNLAGVDFSAANLARNHFAGADLSDIIVTGATGVDVLQIVPRIGGQNAVDASPEGETKGPAKTARQAPRKNPVLYEAIRRSIADVVGQKSVTVDASSSVVGKVVRSNGSAVDVHLGTEKMKPASGKVLKKTRIYKTRSASQWFSVGDTVEIVPYSTRAAH